ncbi:hypothetical protein AJ87_05795 [Rhizobium yanglingense]|nr:hypothetical protein AJ87_05795 [Rhizobium yanglingense]
MADGARQIGVAVRTAEVDEGDDGVERCTQRFAVDQSTAIAQGGMVAKTADGAHQVAVDERQAIGCRHHLAKLKSLALVFGFDYAKARLIGPEADD